MNIRDMLRSPDMLLDCYIQATRNKDNATAFKMLKAYLQAYQPEKTSPKENSEGEEG